MAWVATDTFNSNSDTTLSGWNGGSGWSVAWAGAGTTNLNTGEFAIDTTQTYEGVRAVHVTAASAQAYIERLITTPVTVGTVYFAIRAAQANKAFYIQLNATTGANRMVITFATDGNIKIYNNASGLYETIQAYSANTWYTVAVDFDAVGHPNQYRASINGGPYTAYKTVNTGTYSSITAMSLEHDAGGAGPQFFFDDIQAQDINTSPKYWVGGSGTWDTSTTTHWSLSTGGASGALPPTSNTTTVFFDGNSGAGTATVGASVGCINLVFTGYTGTLAGSNSLGIGGSLTLVSGMTVTYTGTITFTAITVGQTITSGTKTLLSPVIFNGSGGQWTLQDNMTATTITLTAGSLVLGATTVTLSGIGTVWSSTSGTVVANTSTIKITDASSSSKTFSGNSLTYNNIWITGSGTGTYTISGSNTFNDFKVDTPPHTVNFTAGTTQYVQTFTVNGTAGNLMTLQSTSSGTAWNIRKIGSGTVSCDYLSLKDSHAS